MDDMNEGIGRALREARKRRGWSQAEAAKALDTHPTQLTRYELAQREAPLSFLRKAEAVYRAVIIPPTPHGDASISRETPHGGAHSTVREPSPEGASSWHASPRDSPADAPIRPEDVPGVLLAVEEMALTLASLSRRSRLASTATANRIGAVGEAAFADVPLGKAGKSA